MNWTTVEEKIKNLPDDIQEQAYSFIDILVHNYETEKVANKELVQSDINRRKMDIMKMLLQERSMDLLLNIQNLISNFNTKLTPWEEEQLEIGLNDLESGKKIPHTAVMAKVNQILK